MSDIINNAPFNIQTGDEPAVNKSLYKALLILDSFTEANPEWGVSDLSRHLGIGKSSVSTMLSTLASLNFVYQSPTTRRYRLGPRCLELGYVASSRLVIRNLAFPCLETLLQGNRIVYMGIPYLNELLYIETLFPIRRQVNYSSVGRRAPLYCTAIGKAILAYMPPLYIEEYINTVAFRRHTPNTIMSAQDLREELEMIQKRGYSIDRQETELGIQCVGAPVRGSDGNVIAAISISGSPKEINFDNLADLSEEILKVSRDISQKVIAAG
jgi:IclR family transcriptional regulator, KDG regulon repressor